MDAAALSRVLGDWQLSGPTLPDALATAITELIGAGLVSAGVALPAQRELAATLGVSRGTVATAFAALEAGGLVASVRGSGSRVRSGRGSRRPREGRLFSFTAARADVVDLSTGALPASRVAREVLAAGLDEAAPYLDTDGYFPAGLPVLRQMIAEQLTRDGLATRPAEVLVTSGAQHATFLAVNELLEPGDLALVEDPSYRGGLEAMRSQNLRLEGIPLSNGGLDVGLVAQALKRRPAVLYCQISIHNPTGQTMGRSARAQLAELVNRHGLLVIEDACSYNLTHYGPPARTLAPAVDPSLMITIGTLSKLFWGGLRVGWLRADEARVRALVERRKVSDLAGSVADQLLAVRALARASEARAERQQMLRRHLTSTEAVIGELFEDWVWAPIKGGTGLWVDTGADAQQMSEAAKRVGVKLAAGPSASPYEGQRSMIRLPLWHEADELRRGLELVRDALAGRRPAS